MALTNRLGTDFDAILARGDITERVHFRAVTVEGPQPLTPIDVIPEDGDADGSIAIGSAHAEPFIASMSRTDIAEVNEHHDFIIRGLGTELEREYRVEKLMDTADGGRWRVYCVG